MTLSPDLQKQILDARERLSDAERELSSLLSALEVNERADKKMIGETLKIALERVIAAKTHLVHVLDG